MDKKGVALSQVLSVNRVISAFYHRFSPGFYYDGEQHPGWEFVYVESGQARAKAGDQTYILKSGEMVCHKPMEFHRIEPYHGDAGIIIICFDCQSEKMQFFRNKILTLSPRQKQYLNDIVSFGEQLLQPKSPLDIVRDGAMDRRADARPDTEQQVKNTTELLILSLLDAQSTERSTRADLYEQYLHRRHLTREVEKFLREDLSRQLRLEDLTEQFPYSLSSIRRIFKKETGMAVMEYLTQQRMERSKELLKDPHITVGAVASAVGFANIYYFSQTFKKHTGKSPTAYRKALQMTVDIPRSEKV